MANQNAKPVRKSEHGDTDMKSFYASLESSDTSSPSLVSLKCTSEKTKKAIHTLQDLLSKEISFLSQPIHCTAMKNALEHLLTLPENEGLPMAAKSEIQKLQQRFEHWSLEYHYASSLSATAEAKLSKASEVKNDLQANAKEFKKMDSEGNIVFYNLEFWQTRKRKLEEKLELTNGEIERYKEREDEVAKKKTELFDKGRMLKADWDDMMIRVPEVKAEWELANQTQDNIEFQNNTVAR
ncbi:hypothetical protein TSUD_296700 [Trifolium subterraneum]|uniref:Uncharacterized protein n=1 Tax=Trifolium subterraneum TaxID=3900 RepID=A0A2Z6PTV3_TRISU|nr:hypothetical protein TSUD_296700 [Trifolium subterraneum]